MGIPDGIETGGVTIPPRTLQGSFVPVLKKCPKLVGGGGGGLLKTIAVNNIKYSECLKKVCNSRFLYRFL